MQFCYMEKLNFPMFNLPTKSKENKNFIFDSIRKNGLFLHQKNGLGNIACST